MEKLNYVEFPCKNFSLTQSFFETVFNWSFTPYGDDYLAFSAESAGLEGGFFKSNLFARQEQGSVLMVFLSDDLEKIQKQIIIAGGQINVPVFEFPGGRRFHFIEPSGNEFAVWSMD